MRRYSFFVITMLILFGVAAAQEKEPRTADDYFVRGNARLDKGDLDGAISDFTKAISLNPNDADAYNQRGLARIYKGGDSGGAIADYDKAIALNPDYAAAYVNRGNARAAKGDRDGAMADFNKAIEVNPNLAAAYDSRSFARREKGDIDGAIDDLLKAAALDPRSGDDTLMMARGTKRYEGKDYDGAISDFTKAIAVKPDEVDAYVYRGLARDAKGDADGAMADYDKAVGLVSSLVEHNRRNLADYNLRSLADAYNSRGLARRKKGDYGGAEADYTKAIAVDAGDAEAYNSLAWLLATSPKREFRDGKRAVEMARKAGELSKWKDPGILDTLAAAYAEAGDFRQAVEWEKKALGSPDYPKDESERARQRLGSYGKHQPYREQ